MEGRDHHQHRHYTKERRHTRSKSGERFLFVTTGFKSTEISGLLSLIEPIINFVTGVKTINFQTRIILVLNNKTTAGPSTRQESLLHMIVIYTFKYIFLVF